MNRPHSAPAAERARLWRSALVPGLPAAARRERDSRRSPHAPGRALGLCWAAGLLAACSATSEPRTGDLRLDIQHADPRVRFESMRLVVDEERRDLIPDLVGALADRDGAVRLAAAIALRKLTGEDLEYKPYGTPAEREEAQRRWEVWVTVHLQGERLPGEPHRSESPASPSQASGQAPGAASAPSGPSPAVLGAKVPGAGGP